MRIHHFALIFALLANASANILIKSGMRRLELEGATLVQIARQILTNGAVLTRLCRARQRLRSAVLGRDEETT